MTAPGAPAVPPLDAVRALLDEQRAALVSGDVAALGRIAPRLQALLADPSWRRAVADDAVREAVRAALATVAVNAGLAGRAESGASRGLAALGVAPALYTASGSRGAGTLGGPTRSVSA